MKESKPCIYDPAFLPTNIYSGVPSFLNLSVLEKKEDLKKVDVAVLGVPWEGGCTIGGYSSCTEGPKSIRTASIRYTGYLPDFDLDSLSVLKAGDYGDCAVQNGNYDFTFQQIRERYGEIVDAGAVPILFGGDHGIAYPAISELAKRHPKRVGVLHFDAHLDNYNAFGVLLSTVCTMILTWMPPRLCILVSGDPEITNKNGKMPRSLVLP